MKLCGRGVANNFVQKFDENSYELLLFEVAILQCCYPSLSELFAPSFIQSDMKPPKTFAALFSSLLG